MDSSTRRVRARSSCVPGDGTGGPGRRRRSGGAAAPAPAAATVKAPSKAEATTESADATLGYRANARHDGFVAWATAAPPFTKAWSVDLGSAVSAPLAVGGKVFVVGNAAEEEESDGPRMELVGLDATPGKRLWPQQLITGRLSPSPRRSPRRRPSNGGARTWAG
ncbi:hypothetical protein [Streptomyces massasporeus]|uniref:hypothetical protein n=1 Tax=Streptomyces massasporeus TaxID=67324 RepID=UPI0033D3F753